MRWLIATAIGGIVLLGVVPWIAGRFEPRHHGRTLAQWVETYRREESRERVAEAQAAIRALSSNALPEWVERINYDPLERRARTTGRLRWAPSPLRRAVASLALPDRREALQATALGAIEALGPEAGAAAPRLEQLAASTNRYVAGRAMSLLPFLGVEGLNALLRLGEDPALAGREFALSRISTMQYLGANAAFAVPRLVRCAEEPHPRVSLAAVQALAQLGLDPERSLPVFSNKLHSPDPVTRMWSLRGMGRLGPSAADCAPILERLAADAAEQEPIRREASHALGQIVPGRSTN